MRRAAFLACLLLTACATSPQPGPVAAAASVPAIYQPPVGSTLVLEGPVIAAPGHHIVMGDLVATPRMAIPRHSHSGEEFLYVIGGAGTVSIEGQPDVTLKAGQGVRIAPGSVHSGLAGADGMRAISTWVVVNGQPLRTPAP
jgi:quercetin dioxygenase-like cupin family protein